MALQQGDLAALFVKTLVRSHPGSMIAIGEIWYGICCVTRPFNLACEDDRWDLVEYSLDTTVVFFTGIKEIVSLT